MSEQTVGLPARKSRWSRSRALGRKWLLELELRPLSAWIVVSLLALMLAHYFWLDEGSAANILFTAAVTAGLIAFVVLLSRRVLFATVVVSALIVLIVAAAAVKRSIMNMVVHAYDLFFYLSSWSTLSFLWSDHRRYVLSLIGGILAATAISALAYRADPSRLPRRWAAAGLIACALMAGFGAYAKGERRHMQFYYSGLYLSSFYASWGETIEALYRGTLMEAALNHGGPAFTIPSSCPVADKPPHIILIHQESVVQPSLFKALRYDSSIDPLFRSDDDILHALRVETYGGASWLTEFSLLAGVSTHAFGGMRQFVQTFTQNRLKDTLPQALARCGYRNVVFYPMLKNFVSNDRFYSSIGLKEIFDLKAQGAPSAQERDRFYYNNALGEMERHFRTSRAPLFTFIQTMSAHWPYDFTYEPALDVPGGGPGTDPEMSEYLRRVAIAKIDYDGFIAALQRRFPEQRFLIVHYGDHQPMATRTLLGYHDDTEAEDVLLDPDSIGFHTYYAVHGLNYRLPQLPRYQPLDVAYLGSIILDLAALPLSDSHAERLRLMVRCNGRYWGCASHEDILAFHRRLIDSGVVIAE
ncbi:MAG TPA: sulfatase-like hydrolase/transferase [Hyphomicrobiaceae bacterium]|nr:sulfatase-like hydrolase/transferase [Hyphomicrobiaceae bacterium]